MEFGQGLVLGLGYETFFPTEHSQYMGHPKIQQTKIFVTCQRFGDLFLFGLGWQYQIQYDKGRFKVMSTYLQQ